MFKSTRPFWQPDGSRPTISTEMGWGSFRPLPPTPPPSPVPPTNRSIGSLRCTLSRSSSRIGGGTDPPQSVGRMRSNTVTNLLAWLVWREINWTIVDSVLVMVNVVRLWRVGAVVDRSYPRGYVVRNPVLESCARAQIDGLLKTSSNIIARIPLSAHVLSIMTLHRAGLVPDSIYI